MKQYAPHANFDPERCMETVYIGDIRQLFMSRGFRMHYKPQQCLRHPQEGRAYCFQHPWGDPGGKMEAEKGAPSNG